MTPERRAKLLSRARTVVMVAAFAGMAVAVNHLVRSYSYDQIATALGSMPVWVIFASIGLLAVQHAMHMVREWLAVSYAGRSDLGPARTALASLVSRSLSSLGVATFTGVALRLRIYSGWGLTTADVAKVAMYNELAYLAGLTSQLAFAFVVLPVPIVLAEWIPASLVRAIGIAAAALLVVYVVACARGPSEIRIRTLVIPVPAPLQVAGTILLPVLDLAVSAAIVYLCLPSGLSLGYLHLIVVCLISSIAGSLTQIPAGLGVLEGVVLLFARAPDAAPAVISGLLVRRIITNLLPITVGGILLGLLELRRRPETPRPAWLAESMAAVLSTLTFIAGVIVMVLSTSPLGDRLDGLGQAFALAAGTGILLVSRGLVRRSRLAWQIAVGLVLVRAIAGIVVPPPLPVAGILGVLGILLVLSRTVFLEKRAVVDNSLRWWIAFGLAMTATAWNAFVLEGRHVTRYVLVWGGIMMGVAALGAASFVVHLRQRRRERRQRR